MLRKIRDLHELVTRRSTYSARRRDKSDIVIFILAWWEFLAGPTMGAFFHFEGAKGIVAESLYKQRGKFARPFIHSGMMGICAMGVILAPVVSESLPGRGNPLSVQSPSAVLSAATENPEMATQESEHGRDKIYNYQVQDGDTVASIADKFGISQDTVLWQNDLTKKSQIKAGQSLEILPVTGVSHKVEKGETIYSIAKKFNAEPQAILDFPFNTFVNDETFALAIGETIIIPDGTPPQAPPTSALAHRQTPNAGTVTASGDFVWPTAGVITQSFSWYHSGIDIANNAMPDILAADSGTVTVSGWPDNSGYGMRIEIDHGNGFSTLYGHLSQTYVHDGQTVRRGDPIGKMGSTGRSTGIHLHFEVRTGGAKMNPLNYLK